MITYSRLNTLRARVAWVLATGAFIWVVPSVWAQDKQPQEPAPLAGCEDQVRSGGQKGKQERFFPPAPLAGCEDQVRSGGQKGKQERFFPLPLPKVKEAAAEALQALEFEVKKDTKDSLEAHKARHTGVFVGSGGEKVRLDFREAEQNGQK